MARSGGARHTPCAVPVPFEPSAAGDKAESPTVALAVGASVSAVTRGPIGDAGVGVAEAALTSCGRVVAAAAVATDATSSGKRNMAK